MAKQTVIHVYQSPTQQSKKQTNKQKLLTHATTWINLLEIILTLKIKKLIPKGCLLSDSMYVTLMKSHNYRDGE